LRLRPEVPPVVLFNLQVGLKQHKSVTMLIATTVRNLVTPKAAAKPEILFNKLASGRKAIGQMLGSMCVSSKKMFRLLLHKNILYLIKLSNFLELRHVSLRLDKPIFLQYIRQGTLNCWGRLSTVDLQIKIIIKK
jgi:hypothetical protein